MMINGPSRPLASRLTRKLIIPILSSLAIVAATIFDGTSCFADARIARTTEKQFKQFRSKSKAGASSWFGVRRDPINKRRNFHRGIDVSRPAGTKVLAWSHGVVTMTGWLRGYGRVVDVLHTSGIKTRYAHLRRVHVREGQSVKSGEILGQVGRTGRTTGANLHFEVIVDDRQVDPREHLSDASRILETRNKSDG